MCFSEWTRGTQGGTLRSSPSSHWTVPPGADPASCPGFCGPSSKAAFRCQRWGCTSVHLPEVSSLAKALIKNGYFAIHCWVELPSALAQRTIFLFPSWAQSGHPQSFELLVDFPSLPLSLDSFSIKPVKRLWGQQETPLTLKMGPSKVHF